ncbi:MAG: hypothetical protein ACK56U_10440 [Planctomyces sp.]
MRSVGWCFVVYSGWIVGVAAVLASGGLWAEDLRGRTRSLETGGLRRGFEAGVLLRGAADASSGYRVQLSTKYQECALVRYPDGGYVLMDGGNVISRHAGWFVCIQWWSWGVSCAGAGKRGLGA